MDSSPELPSLVPPDLLDLIRDRIKAGVADAEAKYSLNAEEEDSVTGALAQAISTPGLVIVNTERGSFEYGIKSTKLRGRGKGAPEKHLGADAIFQLEVFNQNECIFKKGLPFQSKKGGGFGNAKTLSQAKDLYRTSKSGIVVRYSPTGYTGVDVRELIRKPDSVIDQPKVRPSKLSSLLGDDFLNCQVGRMGLFYDPSVILEQGKGMWAITTTITQRRG